MKDIYVYKNSNVLKNKLGIHDESLFKDAEADYVIFRLKAVAKTPLAGNYDFAQNTPAPPCKRRNSRIKCPSIGGG